MGWREGLSVTEETVSAMMLTEAQQDEIARGLVARARAEGAELVGPDGVLSGLTKRVLETALEEELTDHLGYGPYDPAGHHSGNSRNGARAKTVLTEVGPVQVDVPRDRAGTFEPVIVPKGKRRLEGVDRIVLSLTARGLTTGEISAHFAEVYGASIAKDTISRISDRVIEEMTEWLHRPLDEVYPVVFIDAIVVKVRDGQVTNKPFYVAIGVTVHGERDILGIWSGDGGEGANVLAQRTHRDQEPRCRRRPHARVRRAEGPAGRGQHRVGKDGGPNLCDPPAPQHVPLRSPAGLGPHRQGPPADLHRGQRADGRRTVRRVRRHLANQVPRGGRTVGTGLERVRAVPGLRRGDPQDHCHHQRIESLNARYRRAVRARGHFPTDQAALKCLYLVTRSLDPTGRGKARWVIRWKAALNAFAITFEGRLSPSNN